MAKSKQHMNDMTTQQDCLLRTRVTETARKPRHLTAIATGLLLSIMPFFTGCGTGEPGSQSTVTGDQAAAQAPLRLSLGIRSQTPQSLPISSITVSNHRAKQVAAHTKTPSPLTPRQPRSQT